MHSAGRHSTNSADEPQKGKRRLRIYSKAERGVRKRRLYSRKRKFTAGLLAAICPGLGHIYLGLYRKGVSLIFALMLDASALLYFSSIGIQINVPLLILLALLFPVAYFYSVYDVLQAADYVIYHRRRAGLELPDEEETERAHPFALERSIAFGVYLVAGGLLMIAFYQKPKWLGMFIEQYGQTAAAVVLIVLGLFFGLRETLLFLNQRRGR
ncbi:hypothetical protein [Paenibacillus sp. PSB04]|uniref:hypothetical protein n=1 Tax=Paenibacillus sp. PSB04 TaxID=2866810 RepID=UPI0021F15BDC|nr:hypothetical protein [Paenibacillus sp. PSB04]UYO04966.1 hypothetical protein K2F33_02975 [Paenibacillus sp. PSB04]